MCGNEAPLKRAEIEGTEMRVCSDCLEYGEEVSTSTGSSSPSPTTGSSSPSTGSTSRGSGGSSGGSSSSRDVYEDSEKMLAEDYGQIVKQAREEAGLTAEELSNEINEKRSTVAKTERGEHHPSDDLVGKLERFLDVELMVEAGGGSAQRVSGGSSGSSSGVTLGDLIEDEMEDED
jgi:putative transcription factor